VSDTRAATDPRRSRPEGLVIVQGDANVPPLRREASSDSPKEAHQEWLIDEALKETFPASDPISPAMPRAQRP
jgi:hypothetical protein